MLNPNPVPILSSASSPNTVIRDEVSYVEKDEDEISGHNHHQQDLSSEVANGGSGGGSDIDGEMSEQTASQPQQPDLYIFDVTNQQCNIEEEEEEEEVTVDEVQETYDRPNSSNSREQSRRRSSGPGLPSADYQLEINKSRQQFDTIRQLFEQTYKRTVIQTNTASVVSRSQSRQSVHFAEDCPDFVATSMSRSNVGNSSVMSDDQELMLIPANTVLSFVNFFESKYPSSVGHKTSSNVKSSRRKAPPVPPTTPHPVSNDDKADPPIWLDKAKNPLEDELKKTNPVARNTSTGSRSSSSFKSTTTTTTATSSSSNFEDSSTNGSSNRLFNNHLEKSKPKVKIHRQSNLPTEHSSFIDYFDPIGPNHNDVNNNTFLHKHHHHHNQPHKTAANGFSSISQDSTKNEFNEIDSDVRLHPNRDKFHDADDEEEEEEEEEEVPIEHRFKSDPLDKTQFTKCDIRINIGKSADHKQRNRIKTRQWWRHQQRRQRRTKKRGPTTLRPVSIELNLFNQSDITSSSEDQSTSSPVPSLPSKYRYQLHILSQNLRSIFTQLFELDSYPRTYRAYNRRSSQFGQDPAEWKRKAIYRRNLSSIDQYLQKNLSQSSGSNNVFQSNFPWKTFVINSRFHTRIESLSESEIKLYESIFEIIMTERSYLNHLEELKEFPSKNASMIGQLSKYDQNVLFGNVNLIYSANRDLYEQFVVAFGKSIFMSEVIVILSIFLSGQGSKKFEPYIDYVRAQNERSRLMQDETLMAKCGGGGGVSSGAGTGTGKTLNLAQLQGLLITPMQRITRYPILLGAIRDRLLKIISQSDNSNATSEPNGSNETVPNVDSSSASPSPTPSPQSTVDRRRQSNPQPPAHQLLLSLVDQCWENAKRFAQKCNQALDNQNNLLELIEFKKRLVGDLGFELVSTERKIVTRVSVLVSKKYPNHSTMMNSTVSSASSLLMTLNHKCILIMLSDLLILAVDKQKKKNKFILLNNAPWNLVEYRKGLPQPSINHNQSSSPTAVPSQPEASTTFSHQDSSTPSLHSTMEYESNGSIADPMTPMVSMPLPLSIPTPPPPPPPPTTGPSLLIGTIKFTKNLNDTVYLVSFPSSEIEEKFSTDLNRLKSQN